MQELLDAVGIDQRFVQLLEILGAMPSGFSHHSHTHPRSLLVAATHGDPVKRRPGRAVTIGFTELTSDGPGPGTGHGEGRRGVLDDLGPFFEVSTHPPGMRPRPPWESL